MKLSANQLKYVKSLQVGKYRQKYHKFIVEGAKMAAETLADPQWNTMQVYAQTEWIEENKEFLEGHSSQIIPVSPGELRKISLLSTPNQVLLVVEKPDWSFANDVPLSGLTLYLDNLQDPGNMGTILRIADWFGISRVFRSKNCVDVFNPKVIQASMGAFLRVKSPEAGFTELRERYPALPCYGAVLDGTDVFLEKLPDTGMLVIGNESKGISPEILEKLTHRISIPKHPDSKAESLNAAVATGILCALWVNSKL
jgi:TrmH family RNA methyltransferase